MTDKYDILLERSIRAQEQGASISNSLLEVAKEIKENVKALNDNFVLHNQVSQETACQTWGDIKVIKSDLIKWLKITIFALIIAVGGASVVKLLFDFKIL
jgi:hypothetical protein